MLTTHFHLADGITIERKGAGRIIIKICCGNINPLARSISFSLSIRPVRIETLSLGFSFLSSIRSRFRLKPKRNGFDLIRCICSRMWVGETRFVRGPECRERNYDSPRLLRTNNILGVDPSCQDFISPSLNCQKSHFLQRSSNMPI